MKLAYWIAEYYCAPIEHGKERYCRVRRRRGAKHKKQLEVSLLDPDGVGSSALKKSIGVTAEQGPMLHRFKSRVGLF